MSMRRRGILGLRLVAVFEAIKGVLAFAAALSLLSVLHEDLHTAVAELIGRFYLSPASHAARLVLAAAEKLDGLRVLWLAAFAFCYAGLRFVEAYGLWYARRWAEWIAALGSAIYLPLEIVELARGITWLRLSTLAVNAALCIYMTWKLWSERKREVQRG